MSRTLGGEVSITNCLNVPSDPWPPSTVDKIRIIGARALSTLWQTTDAQDHKTCGNRVKVEEQAVCEYFLHARTGLRDRQLAAIKFVLLHTLALVTWISTSKLPHERMVAAEGTRYVFQVTWLSLKSHGKGLGILITPYLHDSTIRDH